MEKELPIGWVETELHVVSEILDNLRKPINSTERGGRIGNIPYYGATGQAGWIDDFLFDEELVLVGEDGAPFFDKTKNVAYLVNGKSWVNNHAHVLKAISKISSNKFLLHFLNQFDYKDFVGGTTRLKLTQGDLKIIPIPLPPLPEQQRIVAKLDTLFGLLDALKTRLDRIPQLLKDFRQKVLTQAVTGKLTEEWREGMELDEWKNIELKSVCLSITDGDHQAPPQVKEGVPFLVISNVSKGYFDFDSITRFVPRSYFETLKATRIPQKGDVLYTVTGSFGIPILVDFDREFCFQRHIAILKPNRTKINSSFLQIVLSSTKILEQAREVATGTAQFTVPLNGIRNFTADIPKLEEQHEIVRRVESLFAKADQIEAGYQKLKVKIEQLPQALLAKAFRGELVEQLPTDGDARELLEEIRKAKAGLEKGGRTKKMKENGEVRMVAEDGVRYGKK